MATTTSWEHPNLQKLVYSSLSNYGRGVVLHHACRLVGVCIEESYIKLIKVIIKHKQDSYLHTHTQIHTRIQVNSISMIGIKVLQCTNKIRPNYMHEHNRIKDYYQV